MSLGKRLVCRLGPLRARIEDTGGRWGTITTGGVYLARWHVGPFHLGKTRAKRGFGYVPVGAQYFVKALTHMDTQNHQRAATLGKGGFTLGLVGSSSPEPRLLLSAGFGLGAWEFVDAVDGSFDAVHERLGVDACGEGDGDADADGREDGCSSAWLERLE